MGLSPIPSGANTLNVLTAQTILYDDELIPNLKGETDAFTSMAVRRNQGKGVGINRTLFMYNELGADIESIVDGVVGSPEFVSQVSLPLQVAEWGNFANFSAMSVYAAIDDLVGNTGVELGYQAGQTISDLYSETLDNGVALDSAVNVTSGTQGTTPLDLNTFRSMKQSLVSIGVNYCKNGKYNSAISPNVVGDLQNGTTVNNAVVDFWKFTREGQEKFEKFGSASQREVLDLPGTGIRLYQTPFVKQTANFQSTGKIAFRTYLGGEYALIGVWLDVPGDIDLGDGDWRGIECGVVTDAPSSVIDPTATIGAWCYYRFHQTVSLVPVPSGITSNTQRYRVIDTVPALQ